MNELYSKILSACIGLAVAVTVGGLAAVPTNAAIGVFSGGVIAALWLSNEYEKLKRGD